MPASPNSVIIPVPRRAPRDRDEHRGSAGNPRPTRCQSLRQRMQAVQLEIRWPRASLYRLRQGAPCRDHHLRARQQNRCGDMRTAMLRTNAVLEINTLAAMMTSSKDRAVPTTRAWPGCTRTAVTRSDSLHAAPPLQCRRQPERQPFSGRRESAAKHTHGCKSPEKPGCPERCRREPPA